MQDIRKDCALQSHTGRSNETRETASLLQTALLAEGTLISHQQNLEFCCGKQQNNSLFPSFSCLLSHVRMHPAQQQLFAILIFAATHLAPPARGRESTGQLGAVPSTAVLGSTKSGNKDLSLPLLSFFPCCYVPRMLLWQNVGAVLLSAHSPTASLMGPGCIRECCQAWGGVGRHHLTLNSHTSARLLPWGCWTGVGGLEGPFHRQLWLALS